MLYEVNYAFYITFVSIARKFFKLNHLNCDLFYPLILFTNVNVYCVIFIIQWVAINYTMSCHFHYTERILYKAMTIGYHLNLLNSLLLFNTCSFLLTSSLFDLRSIIICLHLPTLWHHRNVKADKFFKKCAFQCHL